MLRLTIVALVLLQTRELPSKAITVTFPKEGKVEVLTEVAQGRHPRILFRSVQTSKVLLDATVGTEGIWREIVDKDDPEHHVIDEVLVSLHRPGLPDPLVVSMARYGGGSDCPYKPVLFGEVAGSIAQLTPNIPNYETRGGIFLSTGAEITLTVVSERYQEHDVHYSGPSRMAVYRYVWNGSRFLLKSQAQVPTDAVHVSGERLDDLFVDVLGC